MPFTDKCLKLPAAVPLIAMLWLVGCATVGSEVLAPCPPVVEYSQGEQVRAAGEIEALREATMTVRMLSDYAVLRDQTRACR
ncbi:hypothetical protein [Pararhodobacter zhoushanensis]|uniref:Lipoprotein n=1 Tax=Pararhodobacter zhoushanensis TaxID=2479545 RepID=A0ABT3GU32_9RHOB|nr:hypothetical protein [Pararhodobacter zhoushanensis]MCW1931045.1 hypothetical protein [Pararhodobacter zhoushanensis]